MQPSLSLTYGGGYGLLGVGFSLGGLSAIAPCQKTLASDGEVDGIDFDPDDAYCLDGAKLVDGDVTGDDDWSDGKDVAFHTELESFQRVIAHSAELGQQPEWFEVHGPDGSKARYDAVVAFRHQGVNAAIPPELDDDFNNFAKEGSVAPVYPIASVEDRFGNRIRYNYDINADAIYPEVSYRIGSIDYAFMGPTTPTRRIVFHYLHDRPDTIVRYVSGVKMVSRSRLTAIEMLAPNPTAIAPVWSYELESETSPTSGRLRLKSAMMKDQFGVASWTRRFQWTDSWAPVEDTLVSEGEFDRLSVEAKGVLDDDDSLDETRWYPAIDVRLLVYDTDGDGLDDILYRTHSTRFNYDTDTYEDEDHNLFYYQDNPYERGRIRIRRSTEDAPLAEMTDVTNALEPTPYYFGIWGPDLWQAHLGKSRIADLDGDGRLDLLLARTLEQKLDELWQTDADAEHCAGEPENCFWNQHRWFFGYAPLGETPWDQSQLASINDVVVTGPVFRDASDSLFDNYHLIIPPFQRVLADLDGDGLPDHVDAHAFRPDLIDLSLEPYLSENWFEPTSHHYTHYPYQAQISSMPYDPGTPPPWFEQDPVSGHDNAIWTCNNGNALVTDYEGDGRADVLVASDTELPNVGPVTSTGIYMRLRLDDADDTAPWPNHEQSLQTTELWGGDCGQHRPDVVMGDWNGDGLEDILYPPGSWGPIGLANEYNTVPKVRWNIGNGFSDVQDFPVSDAALGARMQNVPPDWNGLPAPWDLGTRSVDLDHDGRTDIVAFRPADPAVGEPEGGLVAIAYLSRGGHFEAQILGAPWDTRFVNDHEGWTLSQVGDTDGDGAVELVHVVGRIDDEGALFGDLVVTQLPWRMRGDLLIEVEDSGTEYPLEVFDYTTSWWGSGPRPEPTTCAYPSPCSPRRGFPVVRQHAVYVGADSNGGPRYRQELHNYGDPRVDITGRGYLGFAWHRIWDRELGAETMRWFDNVTRLPANQQGEGVFYPYAAVPYHVRTIVPDAQLPNTAELGSGSNMPGLEPLVKTRTVDVAYEYELRWDGRHLTRLPSVVERTERDVNAEADHLLQNPQYVSIDEVSDDERTITTTTIHDEYGNPTSRVTETAGGVTRETLTQYQNVIDDETWLLGLPLRIEQRSDEPGDLLHARIVETQYDLWNLPTYIRYLADDGGIEELARTTYNAYDTRGNLIQTATWASDDPMPRTTHVYWDAQGVYPKAASDPAGFFTVSLRHPALGVPVLDVDANGVTTTRTYDGFGRPRTIVRPGAATTTLSYVDAGAYRGLEISAHAPDGLDVYAVTDDLGRAVERGRRGFGGIWSYSEVEYDHFGHIVRETAPSLTLPALIDSEATYDRLGRLLSTTAPDGGVTELEHSMFATTSWDAEDHESYVMRDEDGRVIETGHMIDGAKADTLKFGYAAFDQVDRVVHGDSYETSIVHDAFGRTRERTDPDRGTTTFDYDGFGQLRFETRANGDMIERIYDVLGRVVETTGPDGTETFDYDAGPGAAHRLTSAISTDDVLTEIEYDSLGRTREIRQSLDEITHSVVHQYDPYGRLKYLYYPEAEGFDRFTTYYSYGSEGLLLSIEDATKCNPGIDGDPNAPMAWPCSSTPLWTVLARDERLALRDVELGNGQLVQRTYDEETGQLTQVAAPDRITNFFYDYDGHVTQREEQNSGRIEQFEYDDLHRLGKWTLWPSPKDHGGAPPAIETVYDYTELGDLWRVTTDGNAVFEAVIADGRHAIESTTTEGDTYLYDDAGRQYQAGERATWWNQRDLPIEIATGEALQKFRYDALGNRARVEADDETVTYLDKLFEYRDGPDGVHNIYYVHGEPSLVAQVDYGEDEEIRYVISDPLDSATTVMLGDVVSEQAYFDPFGARVDTDGAPAADDDKDTTFGFTGHEEDGDGLINMRGRIYDRAQYRFLTPDPIIGNPLFGQSYNPYSYVLNNPTNLVDPTGFQAQSSDWETFEEDESKQRLTIKNEDGSSLVVERDCSVSMNCDEPPAQNDGGVASDRERGGKPAGTTRETRRLDRPDRTGWDERSPSMTAAAEHLATELRRIRGEEGPASPGEVAEAFASIYADRMRMPGPPVHEEDAADWEARMPDEYVLFGGIGPLGVTLTFTDPFTVYVGGSFSFDDFQSLAPKKWQLGGGAYATWLLQKKPANATDLSTFNEGHSISIEGGAVGGCGLTFAEGRSAGAAVMLGVRTPGASAGGGYAKDATADIRREFRKIAVGLGWPALLP